MPGRRPQELIGNLGYIFIDLQVQALTLITNTIVLFNSTLNDVPKNIALLRFPGFLCLSLL